MIALNEHYAGTAPRTATTLNQLETLAAGYDAECQKLEVMLGQLEADLETVKQRHLRGLKHQAAAVAAREAELHSSVERAPALFVRPRTLTLHGTRFGFLANEGRVEWADDAQVVALIRKHFKSRFAELVKTTHTPKKEALRELSPTDLAKLGCRITGAGDTVLIKRVSGDIEKLLNRLIDKLVTTLVAKD